MGPMDDPVKIRGLDLPLDLAGPAMGGGGRVVGGAVGVARGAGATVGAGVGAADAAGVGAGVFTCALAPGVLVPAATAPGCVGDGVALVFDSGCESSAWLPRPMTPMMSTRKIHPRTPGIGIPRGGAGGAVGVTRTGTGGTS